MKRKSGVILHISSLPSPYGIGTLGRAARDFAEFLSEAGISCWQILPVGPVNESNSPYQALSVFAGNPLFIDLDLLAEDGLLAPEDYRNLDWGNDSSRVDYQRVKAGRERVLRIAWRNGWERDAKEVEAFRQKHSYWIEDYAMFMAMESVSGLPREEGEELRLRRREALRRFCSLHREELEYWIYLQYLFFRQWDALRGYLCNRGIELIGDIPIYAAPNSADVWAHSGLFQLDENRRPTALAGCPPDYFSPDGQNWGNPLYDWETMRRQNYRWWMERVAHSLSLCDRLRIDHFRGFEAYYSIPAGQETASGGHWEPGPGLHFFRKLTQRLGPLPIIAEDLGTITPEVHRLREKAGYPGMAVLQFAFEGGNDNLYLPHNITADRVVYTGTHDNDTLAGWLNAMPDWQLAYCRYYTRFGSQRPYWDLIGTVWATVAPLAVAQLQDFLGLGSESRMNTPSTPTGNWEWRVREGALSPALAKDIRDLGNLYGR